MVSSCEPGPGSSSTKYGALSAHCKRAVASVKKFEILKILPGKSGWVSNRQLIKE